MVKGRSLAIPLGAAGTAGLVVALLWALGVPEPAGPAAGVPSAAFGKPAVTARPGPDALRALARAKRAEVRRKPGWGMLERGTLEGEDLAAVVAAVDLEQKPTLGCRPCVPSIVVRFRDGAGADLGRLETGCPRPGLEATGHFRDANTKACQTITLRDAAAITALVTRAVAPQGEAAPSASAPVASP